MVSIHTYDKRANVTVDGGQDGVGWACVMWGFGLGFSDNLSRGSKEVGI